MNAFPRTLKVKNEKTQTAITKSMVNKVDFLVTGEATSVLV